MLYPLSYTGSRTLKPTDWPNAGPTTCERSSPDLPSGVMRRLAGVVITVLLVAGCSGITTPSSSSGPVNVVYYVTGSAEGADITYTASGGDTEQQSGLAVPLQGNDGSQGLSVVLSPGTMAYISAQNTGDYGTIKCRITVDGKTVKTGFSSGGYTIATCSTVV